MAEKGLFMTIPKRKLREAVLLFLFSSSHLKEKPSEDQGSILKDQLKISNESMQLALLRASKVFENLSLIDGLIEKTSNDYEINRIGKVELSILRLSIYELLIEKELAKEIIIAEAIRLARKFANKESSSYVHALLDTLGKSQEQDVRSFSK